MELNDLIGDDNIDLNFKAFDKDDALKKLSTLLCKGRTEIIDEKEVYKILKEREELGSTGIGNEVAIPHGKAEMEIEIIAAIAISHEGVEFNALDEKPVKIFFVLLASKNAPSLHLKILAKISRLLMDETIREKLLKATSIEEIRKILK